VPVSALLLALAAAVLHACWNLVLVREPDVEAATAATMIVCVVAAAPVAAATWRVSGGAWPYVAASGAVECVYVALLAAAYRRAHMSLVYPVARGLAPVLVLLLSVAVLGAGASPGEAAGVCVVGFGILLVRGGSRGGDARGFGLGVATAASIAGYTVLDRYGVRYASAVAYLVLVLLPPAILYPLAVRFVRGPGVVRRAFGWPVAFAGVASFGAFSCALVALRLAPAASVSAVRESSVVIATALAGIILREPVGARRLAGAVAVVAGVGLLALS
jgi:drug/metabolite transporter (DMT)-like permease